jgi:hypothetical protein
MEKKRGHITPGGLKAVVICDEQPLSRAQEEGFVETLPYSGRRRLALLFAAFDPTAPPLHTLAASHNVRCFFDARAMQVWNRQQSSVFRKFRF